MTQPTSKTAACPTCGALVPRAGGACPACLLRLGLEHATRDDVHGDPDPAPKRARTPPPAPSEIAPHFPELEIVELIGQGGMGAVYRARQTKLERTVALKILHADLSSDPAFAERFLREAKALALLAHPHIVAVYDFGERGGHFFLLMELVEGTNLRQVIRGGDLAPRHALAIVREVCEGLQFAHDEGVVHRDIKPENVLIDRKGRVRIADFGLAKLVGPAATHVTLTGPDQVMGTLHYMAPEQMEHPRDVDHRADIYSLGVVFYEMLTGSLPLGRFEPPSHRVQVDVRLDEIVLKTLEREPSRRYQHAVDVKTDVTTVETTKAPAAGAPSKRGVTIGDPMRVADGDDEKPIVVFGVHTNVDFSRGLKPLAVFACIWLTVAWLFNFGEVTFAAGGLLLGGVAYGILTQWIRRTSPELAAALAAESKAKKLMRFAAAFTCFAVGFALMLLAHVASWEHGTSRYEPPPGVLYLASHREVHFDDFEGLVGHTPPPGTELTGARFDRLDRDDLWFSAPPAPYAFGALLAWGAAAACLASWRRDGGRSRFARAFVIPMHATLGLLSVHALSSIVERTESPQLVHVTQNSNFGGPTEETSQSVRVALAERGLAIHCDWSGTLEMPNHPPFQVRWLVAHASSVFDRWRFTWSGAERTTPHVLISLASTEVAKVDLGWIATGTRERDEWERQFHVLFRELGNR